MLFRRYLLLIAAHLFCLLTVGVDSELLGRASWATSAAEWTAGVLLVAVEVAMLVLVVKLSNRLTMGSPALWVIGMLIPYLGTLVFFGFMRSVMNAFKVYGVSVGHFGPTPESLRPRPASEGAA